jgi:hypothetical protein
MSISLVKQKPIHTSIVIGPRHYEYWEYSDHTEIFVYDVERTQIYDGYRFVKSLTIPKR